jgi:hypothetical protein
VVKRITSNDKITGSIPVRGKRDNLLLFRLSVCSVVFIVARDTCFGVDVRVPFFFFLGKLPNWELKFR